MKCMRQWRALTSSSSRFSKYIYEFQFFYSWFQYRYSEAFFSHACMCLCVSVFVFVCIQKIFSEISSFDVRAHTYKHKIEICYYYVVIVIYKNESNKLSLKWRIERENWEWERSLNEIILFKNFQKIKNDFNNCRCSKLKLFNFLFIELYCLFCSLKVISEF